MDDFPEIPVVNEADLDLGGDVYSYCPHLFELYKTIGLELNLLACMSRESPCLSDFDDRDYTVLIGLLNRCSRLILSNVILSHEGLHGETTAIVDRCIFESALKVVWLCEKNEKKGFNRFVAGGLKTELELEEKILAAIQERGDTLPIESRMLASINNHITASELTRTEIMDTPKLPNFAAILKDTGYGRLMYVVGQMLGSHHVHGTWPSLLYSYLEEEDGVFHPRDCDCPTHPNQYVFVSIVSIAALQAFVKYTIDDADVAQKFENRFDLYTSQIDLIRSRLYPEHFDPPS